MMSLAMIHQLQAGHCLKLPGGSYSRILRWFRRFGQRLPGIAVLAVILVSHALGAGEITLRLVDWAGLDEIPMTQEAINRFMQLHPHLLVEYEPNPGRQYEEKILTSLAASTPPDVFLLDSKLIPTFTNKNILLDLSPLLEELEINPDQWYAQAIQIAQRDSALFAFPKGFTPLLMYYNKRLFRDAGLSYPTENWTWEEYLGMAKALTRDVDDDGVADQYGTAFSNYYYYWIPWVWSAGGDVVSPDGRTAEGFLNSPLTEAALQFLIDLRNRHHVAPEVGTWAQTERTGANTQLFSSGKIAMLVDGHWRMPKFLDDIASGTLEVGVVGLPRYPGKQKTNVMYESGWCVPVSAAHPREATLLAAFMAGETASRLRTAKRLEIPAVISIAEEAAAEDPTGMENAFLGEIPFCRQPWGSRIERFSEIEWMLQDAVDEAMINGVPLRTVLNGFVKKVDARLRTIRQHEHMKFKPISEHSEVLHFLIVVTLVVLSACTALYFLAKGRARNTTRSALMFLGPSLLHLAVFIFTPILFSAYLSFHQWDVVVAEKPFIGLGNFSELAGDEEFWNAMKNTLVYTLNVPLGMTLSLCVALALHKRVQARGFLRTLYFLPGVTSFVALALVWMWIYHPSFGVANFFLTLVGLPPLPWLNSPQTAMLSLIIFSIWLGLGYQMVIFLAGLQGIPEALYEAARIDGATGRQLFWQITLPMLRPTTFFILVTSIIGSFQVFTSVYVMSAGGPVRSTDVVVYHIYQAAWEQLRMGYASAMSWILFLIIMIATWVQFRFIRHQVEYL